MDYFTVKTKEGTFIDLLDPGRPKETLFMHSTICSWMVIEYNQNIIRGNNWIVYKINLEKVEI